MSSVANLYMVNLDCADPRAMAGFYSALLDWDVPHCEDEVLMISDGTTSIGFGRTEDYRPPKWPPKPTRFLSAITSISASKTSPERKPLPWTWPLTVPDFQPGGERWRVLLDPEGRPFCLVTSGSEDRRGKLLQEQLLHLACLATVLWPAFLPTARFQSQLIAP